MRVIDKQGRAKCEDFVTPRICGYQSSGLLLRECVTEGVLTKNVTGDKRNKNLF